MFYLLEVSKKYSPVGLRRSLGRGSSYNVTALQNDGIS